MQEPSTNPCLYILLAGLPGTGKSTLANALAAHLQNAVVLNKDEVRAALFPGGATDYSAAQNDICMDAMLSAAACMRAQPGSPRYVFFDGRTFSRAAHILQVTASAEANSASWCILYLWSADDLAIMRLTASNPGHPAGNRDASLYYSLKQQFEPIRVPHLSVDTGRPLQLCIDECVSWLTSHVSFIEQSSA